MARIRTVKPEFWDDEKLATATSRDVRLLYIGMFNHSDDYAVVKGNLKWLQNQIFPYENIKPKTFEGWIEELLQIHRIIPFEVNSEKFFYIKNFNEHQVINRPSKMRNPAPPEDILATVSLNPHGVLLVGREGKGEEGNGKGGEGEEDKKVEIPSWIPKDAWKGFIDMRKRIKAPLTDRAIELIIEKLEAFKKQGVDVGKILDQSTERSWRGIFPLKDGGSNGQGSSRQGSTGQAGGDTDYDAGTIGPD